MKKQLLKKSEVAEVLSVSVSVINELIQHDRLETVEIKPGVIRVKRMSVLRYLKNENPNSKKTVTHRRLFSFLWLAAIAAFVIQLFISGNFGSEKYWQEWRIWLLLGNIGLGVIFFLVAFLTIGKKKKSISIARRTAWSLPIIYLLMTVIPALADVDLSQRRVAPVYNPPKSTINATPTTTQVKPNQATTKATGSQVECIGPDGKHFNTSMEECKKLAEQWGEPLDYMLNCNIHKDCGGGTERMSYIQCMKPCSGKTSPTTSVSANTGKTPVFISFLNTTIYCPTQNVGAVTAINTSMESKRSQWLTNYKSCLDIFQQTDSCYVSCSQILYSELHACTGPDTSSCSSKASDNHMSCLGKCPSADTACGYASAEQKSMISQIENLCK